LNIAKIESKSSLIDFGSGGHCHVIRNLLCGNLKKIYAGKVGKSKTGENSYQIWRQVSAVKKMLNDSVVKKVEIVQQG